MTAVAGQTAKSANAARSAGPARRRRDKPIQRSNWLGEADPNLSAIAAWTAGTAGTAGAAISSDFSRFRRPRACAVRAYSGFGTVSAVCTVRAAPSRAAAATGLTGILNDPISAQARTLDDDEPGVLARLAALAGRSIASGPSRIGGADSRASFADFRRRRAEPNDPGPRGIGLDRNRVNDLECVPVGNDQPRQNQPTVAVAVAGTDGSRIIEFQLVIGQSGAAREPLAESKSGARLAAFLA
jgi:hypothetical protein